MWWPLGDEGEKEESVVRLEPVCRISGKMLGKPEKLDVGEGMLGLLWL